MTKYVWLNKLIFSICLVIIDTVINILSVNAQVVRENIISQNNANSATNKQLKLPKPPQTGTPIGRKTPGATRPENLCPQVNQPVTALVANNGKDYTLSAYPTLWFYIPYQPSAIKDLEFALFKESLNTTTVYSTKIQLKDNSGIIKIALPREKQSALTEGNLYSWQLFLTCQGNETYEPDFKVKGWIHKLATNAELQTQINQMSEVETYQFYLYNEIWYDVINQLAELYFNNPDNPEIKRDWLNLLEVLQQPKLSQDLLLESVLLPPDL